MASKTSEQLRAELIMTIYGIDPATLLVGEVAVTRGGTITWTRAGRPPSSYRIKSGKPPRNEVSRVFGLTDLIIVSADAKSQLGQAEHPSVSALRRTATNRQQLRDERCRITAAQAATE